MTDKDRGQLARALHGVRQESRQGDGLPEFSRQRYEKKKKQGKKSKAERRKNEEHKAYQLAGVLKRGRAGGLGDWDKRAETMCSGQRPRTIGKSLKKDGKREIPGLISFPEEK